MTTITTAPQCTAVLEQLERMYGKQPYFKCVRLNKDDGGLHVDLVCRRDKLPPEGAPHIGSVLQVKVCTVVVG